ncbi:hypothetical protein Fleli_0988 [Bernardetia litoralis DSM 6794]|uniref:Ig-like domain-containing protein n=1 Tax=Bernardetia litoralis (strain ATCC 23117 / DSM 6794 / NBRC 15988 / NCIMB 1366 / Fx l1 / Sio-4) TaxID=880071 RepID=I4AHK1_BERLS|nr:gliding motility-associated C-terminal domain-containing protein [Bernardetia litoralis]AFM03436.1 hypothetical protein Fleli_0988 [Bernardetia litoralis DSM 6794]
MKKYFYILYAALLTAFFYTTSSWNSLYGQGTTCATSTPFCSGSGITYPAGVDNGTAPTGPDYGCLFTQPNPAWFYFQIDNGGDIQLQLFSTPSEDIDYAIWGPFAAGTTPTQACNQVFAGSLSPHDCSYSSTSNELPEITGASSGDIYIMVVTNYSNDPADLTIQDLPGGTGTATTDCAIINDECEVNLGADIDICESEPLPTLDAARPVHDADIRYQWFVDGVSQGAASTTSTFTVQSHVPSLTPHIYKAVVTSVSLGANGCNEGEDEVNVTIKPTPATNLTVFPNDSTLCSAAGNFVRVVDSELNISYQILRNGTPFGGLVAGTGGTILLPLTGMPAGISTVQVQARYTVAPTCTVILTDQAELEILGNIQIDLGLDEVICETASLILDGTDTSHPANATYQWKRSIDGGVTYVDIVGETTVTYTASETLVTPETPFEVFYQLEMQVPGSSCIYDDEIKVTFEPLPLVDRIVEVDSICNTGQGNIRIVNPQSGTRYSYQLYENNAGVIGTAIGVAQSSTTGTPITFTTPTISTTTQYFIQVTNTLADIPCTTVLTLEPEVIVHPLPTAEFSGGADLCQGDDVELTVTMTGTQPFTIVYQRDTEPEVTVTGINADTYSFIVDEAGTYTVNKVQDFFCENLANPVTTVVNVNPNPDFSLGNDTTLCDSEAPLVLEPRNPTDFDNPNYKWFRDGVELVGETGSTLTTTVSSVGITATTYEYTLEVTNNEATNTTNCVFSDAINVTFTPNPVAQINFAGNDVTGTTVQFCDTLGVQTLSGLMPDHASFANITYQWTDLGTGLVVGNAVTLPVSNFNATTDYELLVTDGGTTPLCGNLATVTVQFIENPVATISHDAIVVPAGGSLDFCFDDGAQTLDGVDASHAGIATLVYQWNDVTNGIDLGNNPQITVSNPTNTFSSIDYELIVRDESNAVFCERTATMTINFYPNPEADISFAGTVETGNTLQFCDSDGIQTLDGTISNLSDVPSVIYEWTDLTTGLVVGNNPTLDVDKFGETTTYELTVTDGLTLSCERTAQITIQFIENPVAEISHNGTVVPNGGSLDFCFDEGAQTLDGVHASHASLGTVTYEWNNVTTGTSLGSTPQISVSNPANTFATFDYELIVRDASNPTVCLSTTTITINFYPNPEADISFAGTVETGSTLQFCDSDGTQTISGVTADHAGFGSITYEWTDLTTGLVVGNDPTLDVDKFGETTTYELVVTNGLTPSCERTAQITIQFIENPVAEISHNGTVVPNGGSLDFCFDEGAQTLSGVHASHAGLGTVTYEWNDITNGTPLGNTPQISVSNPTNTFATVDYELIVRDASNPTVCLSTTMITINFPANPVAEIQFNGSAAPATLAFCDSEGARTLEGALPSHAVFGSVTYIWTQVGVGVVSNDNIGTLSVSNFSTSATYTLEVISNDNPNLCSRTDQVVVEFIPSPDTNISFGGNIVTELGFCTSEGAQTISAPASPFYAYQWYRGTIATPLQTTLGTSRTQNVDNFATQGAEKNAAIYTVVVTDTRASCPAQSSIEVEFYAEPETEAATLVVSALAATHCVTGTSTISVTNTEQDVEYQLTRNGTPVAGEIQTPTVDLSTITFDVTETTTLTTGVDRFEYGIIATRIEDFNRRCTQTLVDTATLLIYPEPTATVDGTATVCANEPTDVIFTITGNFPATLTYEVTDTLGNVTVETQVIGAIGSTSPQTFAINTNTNTYKPLSITDRYCSGTVDASEAIITTVHPPVVNWVEFDTEFCIDEAVTFEVVGGIRHEYYINGLPVSSQNPYTIQPNTLAAGTYQIYAKGFATPNGCTENSETLTFTVHPLPVVDLGVDRIKCVDDVVPLVATQTGSFIYDWREIKTDGDIVTVGNGNDSLYVSQQGTYFVIVTNLATGCSDSSNIVSVTNYDTLDVDLGADVYVCNPSSLPYRLVGSDISHQNGTTYEWYKENDNTTIIGTDSIFDLTEEGIYRVTAIDPRGCEARDTIRVHFTGDPDFQIIGHDDYECGEQDTLRIEATNLRNMLIDWQGNGIVSLSDSNRRAIVNVSGIYTVTVTDTSTTANCSVTKSVEVFVRPAISLVLPNTGTGDTTTLCQVDSLLLDAFDPLHDDDYEYVWTWLEGNQVISTTPQININYDISESFVNQRFAVTITDPNGSCFSTDTVNVRFRRTSAAEATVSDSTICLGESITLQGDGGDDYSWTLLGETTSFATDQNVTLTPDSVGVYTYILNTRYNSSVECGDALDTVTVVVNRKAVASIEEDEIRLCENEQLQINAFLPENPAFTRYIWTHEENNLVLSNDSSLNISFNEIQPISYEPFHIILTVYDSLTGCDSTDRVLVKFNRASKITIDSTYRTEVCLGDSVTLNARGATSYTWRKVGDTTALDSVGQITVSLDTVGYHTFIVTGGYENECQNTGDTAIIYVNPLPTIRAHSVDTVSICANDSITLYPSGGDNYVWLNDPTAFDTITVSPKVPTDYIVMGTDSNGCQNIDTVHVYVTPTFELPELLQVCADEMVMIGDSLNFADSAANLRATYFWTETGDTTPFINVGVSGVYTVEVSIDDCSFTRTTEVQVRPKPILELVSDTTLCFELGAEDRFERGQTHVLRSKLLNRDSTTTYLYVWTDSTGQYMGNADSLEIEQGGNYRLRVIARYDTECETNDSTFVTELCQPRIFIPEAFTPNADNLNDNFEIFGKHIKNFEMQIFNRWSEVIYEVRAEDMEELEPQDFWDGTHKGKNVPTGAYIWIIRYTDPFSGSTKQVQKTGSFMIVR